MGERILDIASYQNVTDAGKVADTDVLGVIGKLTQSTGYVNPRADQLVQLRNAGLAVGGYHFGSPYTRPEDQARFFGNRLKALGLLEAGSIFPAYDAENVDSSDPAYRIIWPNAATLNAHIKTWRDVLRNEFGATGLLVYGSESWWRSGMIDPNVWGDDGMFHWVANYNGRPGTLSLGWRHQQDAIHQWRSNAVPFPGISGDGLDDNTTLNGYTVDSLTIGNEDSMAGFTPEDAATIVAAAKKITALYKPTDDDRPLPIGTPDDMAGHLLSVRGLQEKMRNADRLDRTAISNIETVVNQILSGQTTGSQVTLTDAQAQAGFESLGAQLAAQSGEALEGLYQKLVDTNSVDAVREVFAQYVGRASVSLEFEREDPNPSSGG